MIHPELPRPPELSAHSAAAALAAAAPPVQAVLVALGLLGAGNSLFGLDQSAWERPAIAAIVHVAGFVLAGWVARRGLTAMAALIKLLASARDAAERLAAAAERVADAHERTSSELLTAAAAPSHISPAPLQLAQADMRTTALAEIRVALRQQEWRQVEELFRWFTNNYPDDPASVALGEELKAARESAVTSLRDRLDVAREANDLERVLELREPMSNLLGPEALATLNRTLAKWFMNLIQKRMRRGAMTKELAVLATRVAGAFDATPEGASLRAALPTLRRSVGLCARCGQPYTGIADACPSCVATSSLPTYIAPATPPRNGGPSGSSDAIPSEAIAPDPE